jgi:hypothetical protein
MESNKHLLQETSGRLLQTVDQALKAFSSITEQEWTFRPGPNKWSKKEILGHLIDSAANNQLRFVRAQLAEQEYVSFAYEQNFFVSGQNYQEYDTKQVIQLWNSYNSFLAHVIRNVDPEKLNIICRIGNYDPVPLSFIITDYVDHLKHHLDHILKPTSIHGN